MIVLTRFLQQVAGHSTVNESVATNACLPQNTQLTVCLIGQKIHEYFVGLGIPESEAWNLHVSDILVVIVAK